MPRPLVAARALLVLLVTTAACAHGATRRKGGAAAEFVSRSLAHPGAAEADQLAAWAAGDLHARVVRLDRLLDLFDQARFGQDAEARDVLWEALGGHATGRGPEATRDALARLLELALALDEAGVGGDDRPLVADAIAMLSADLQGPASAEDLGLRTLAWRDLLRSGHPRIRDNAALRLYDHVRQILIAASEADVAARPDIAIQALYAEQEDLGAALSDAAPRVRLPWIGAEALVRELDARRAAIADVPAWRELVGALVSADGELARTVRAALPAARDPDLPALVRPRGTGVAESLAPIVRARAGEVVVDAGRPQARRVELAADSTALAQAIRDSLIQDGRGAILLAADPSLPAPDLRNLLRAIRRAQIDRLELALREAHDDAAIGTVVTALGLWVVDGGRETAGAAAFARARIRLHVGGRGAELAIDGARHLAPLSDPELGTALETVARAYPRETVVAITIGDDVRLEQIVDAVASIRRAGGGRLTEVGWLPDDARIQGAADPALAKRIDARVALARSRASTTIDQPFPLAGDDQKRLAGFADAVSWCVPELETPVAASAAIAVEVDLAQGRATAVRALPIAGVAPKRLEPLRACVQDEAYGLRLREHQDKLSVTIRVRAGSG